MEQTSLSSINEPIQPIPLYLELSQKKVSLGEKLFHDPKLSHDKGISCSSCHDLSSGGTDRRANSIGINGALSDVNAPTVFNCGFNFKQFWDGRAETLEDSIDGPTHNPEKIDYNWPSITSKLAQDPSYVAAFAELYSDGVQSHSIKDAITTFERSLNTPNSRFDRYLRGDSNVITNDEKEGYRLFKEYGCARCHQGVGVGGNMFETFGIIGNYFTDRGNVTKADLGRFNLTRDERDRYKFKVPSLRNIALTPPYFHDGQAKTLEDAVAVMARYQLGRRVSRDEIDLLIKFLNTLTGEYKGKPLAGTHR